MSTEHVEDLLSAYLDNALTQEEHAYVAAHLQTCSACNVILADLRHLDALLAKQPRVSPSAALREKIFSAPEYLELIGDVPRQFTNSNSLVNNIQSRQTVPQKRIDSDSASRPQLVAIPGNSKSSLSNQETKALVRVPQRRNMYIQRFMQVMIAACLLLTLGVGSFIGWNLWQEQGKTAHDAPGITPPQSLRQGGPLPAGIRFVFLNNASLWSGPEDGSAQAVRLTPATVTVAPHWVVSPALSGHAVGNLLAYVDTKQGYIHIIRTDGQSDMVVKQPLLKSVSEASWNTPTGSAILSSLSWSPDGHFLAFIAAPTETSTLYIYSTNTNQTQEVMLSGKGSVSHLVWSPNGARIAFEFTHNNVTSILDYNVLTRNVLTVAPTVVTADHPNDTVLTLDWATTNDAPAITWSVGTQGHVHGIWLRHVGDVNGVDGVQALASGEYTQAVYSRSGGAGMGSWLLSRPRTTNADTLLALTLAGVVHKIADGNKIDVVQWTRDGKHITYFDSFASGVGTLHSVDTITGSNTLVTSTVRSTPVPTWSSDGQHLLYSSGAHSFVADIQNGKTQLLVAGSISAFAWSPTSSHTVIVAVQDGTRGVYLVDTQRNTAKSLSKQDANGPVVWTQIP